jgi:hypothetical protein
MHVPQGGRNDLSKMLEDAITANSPPSKKLWQFVWKAFAGDVPEEIPNRQS